MTRYHVKLMSGAWKFTANVISNVQSFSLNYILNLLSSLLLGLIKGFVLLLFFYIFSDVSSYHFHMSVTGS